MKLEDLDHAAAFLTSPDKNANPITAIPPRPTPALSRSELEELILFWKDYRFFSPPVAKGNFKYIITRTIIYLEDIYGK